MKIPTPDVLQRAVEHRDDQTLLYDDTVLITRQDAWTGVNLPACPYMFKDDDARYMDGWLATLSLAALKEGDVHVKLARRPYDPGPWIAATLAAAQNPSPSFEAELIAAGEAARTQQDSEKRVHLFHRLGPRRGIPKLRTAWATRQAKTLRWQEPLPVHPSEVESWAKRASAVRDILGRGGLAAAPMDAVTLRQVRRHALIRGLVHDEPTHTGRTTWGGRHGLVDEFSDVTITPLPNAVRVDSASGTVFTAGLRMSVFPIEMPFPKTPPWLAWLDMLGDWAEADLRFTLTPPKKAAGHLRLKAAIAKDQEDESALAGQRLPIDVQEMADLAHELQYTLPRSRMPVAYGWADVRVDAPDLDTLEDRCQAVIDGYHDEAGPPIELVRPTGMTQVDLLLQGIPGSAVTAKAHQQRWSISAIGGALPQAASGLSHRRGVYVGGTSGMTAEAVMLDQHASIVKGAANGIEGPGGIVLLGNQRAGKSGALAQIVQHNTSCGIHTILIDFAGPLARMALLPRNKGRVRVLNLTEMGGGVLDTMSDAVIPGDPSNPAVAEERRQLTRSVLSLLGWRYIDSDDRTADSEMLRAINTVLAEPDPRLWRVLHWLQHRSEKEQGRNLGTHLSFQLGQAGSDTFTGTGRKVAQGAGYVTTIIIAPGIVLPRAGKQQREWTPTEAVGAAMFTVAAHLSQRLLWDMDENILKALYIDEAHIALAVDAGRTVIDNALRHGPKRGLVTGLATHNTVDLLDERITNSLCVKMLFRSTDPTEQANQLRLVGRQAHLGAVIRTFRNGECVLIREDDVADRVRWHQHDPELREVQDTTPGGARPAADPVSNGAQVVAEVPA